MTCVYVSSLQNWELFLFRAAHAHTVEWGVVRIEPLSKLSHRVWVKTARDIDFEGAPIQVRVIRSRRHPALLCDGSLRLNDHRWKSRCWSLAKFWIIGYYWSAEWSLIRVLLGDRSRCCHQDYFVLVGKILESKNLEQYSVLSSEWHYTGKTCTRLLTNE